MDFEYLKTKLFYLDVTPEITMGSYPRFYRDWRKELKKLYDKQ